MSYEMKKWKRCELIGNSVFVLHKRTKKKLNKKNAVNPTDIHIFICIACPWLNVYDSMVFNKMNTNDLNGVT